MKNGSLNFRELWLSSTGKIKNRKMDFISLDDLFYAFYNQETDEEKENVRNEIISHYLDMEYSGSDLSSISIMLDMFDNYDDLIDFLYEDEEDEEEII